MLNILHHSDLSSLFLTQDLHRSLLSICTETNSLVLDECTNPRIVYLLLSFHAKWCPKFIANFLTPSSVSPSCCCYLISSHIWLQFQSSFVFSNYYFLLQFTRPHSIKLQHFFVSTCGGWKMRAWCRLHSIHQAVSNGCPDQLFFISCVGYSNPAGTGVPSG